MRIGAQPLLRAWNADHAQGITRPLAGHLLADIFMGTHHLHHLRIDTQHGVERGHRILENHGNPVAANGAKLPFRESPQIPALEKYLAARHLRWLIDQSHDRQAGYRFSRSRFSHKAHHFTGREVEIDVVDKGDAAFGGHDFSFQTFDFEHGGHFCAAFGSSI